MFMSRQGELQKMPRRAVNRAAASGRFLRAIPLLQKKPLAPTGHTNALGTNLAFGFGATPTRPSEMKGESRSFHRLVVAAGPSFPEP